MNAGGPNLEAARRGIYDARHELYSPKHSDFFATD
jgi:hypothetical protein